MILIHGNVTDMRSSRARCPLLLLVAAVGLAGTAITACGSDGGTGSGVPKVGAAFTPIGDLVDRLGVGVTAEVIVPPGEEAHEYEPTPKQLSGLESAAVVFYLGNGFQPAVEQAVKALPSSVRKVDLLQAVTLLPVRDPLSGTEGDAGGETLADGSDPHVWLDPRNMAAMAKVVADTLADLGIVTADEATAASERAVQQYDALDGELRTGLATCERHELVTTHRAFGYLTEAYGLTQVSIAGISPSEEPSAKTLEAVAAYVEEHGVTTIFSEENLPADLADTVARETGATTGVLDTLETLSKEQLDAGDDYMSVMRANLSVIRTALGCS